MKQGIAGSGQQAPRLSSRCCPAAQRTHARSICCRKGFLVSSCCSACAMRPPYCCNHEWSAKPAFHDQLGLETDCTVLQVPGFMHPVEQRYLEDILGLLK